MTDVDGLYKEYPNPDSIIREIDTTKISEFYGNAISGGMIPKIESCVDAVKSGVKKAVIVNGTRPEQISDYLIKQISIGTTIKL